jgi:hypothetical protein
LVITKFNSSRSSNGPSARSTATLPLDAATLPEPSVPPPLPPQAVMRVAKKNRQMHSKLDLKTRCKFMMPPLWLQKNNN